MNLRGWLARIALFAVLISGGTVHADEGMWVFDNLPLGPLKERYAFEPTREWVEHLRSAAVRFNSGGSGSFVSADGLVMTNHHVGADMLQKISTPQKDFHKDGFLARTLDEEVKAPDLELNVLAGIEDVTERVNAAVKDGMDDAAASVARRGRMAEIEKESLEKTGLRSDVVTLYQGGRYALYTSKKYTDVRLVMAPEFDIAFFGGDPDNFEYPRYDLDVCFFRAYENGQPAQINHYLKWSQAGGREGDLVFVAGHPGRTDRMYTIAHLEYLRDVEYPLRLDIIRNREAFLLEYSKQGQEQAREAKEDLFTYQNSRKARNGGLEALNDRDFMARKARAEAELRARVNADGRKRAAFGAAWQKIAAAQKVASEIYKPFAMLERGYAFDSKLFQIARTLVRLAEETQKPNPQRLREYRESNLESIELELYSPAPIYPDYEKAKLAHSLATWKKAMGANGAIVERVLRGRTPEQAANEMVEGSKLADVAVRKRIAEGGSQTIDLSDDAMIKFALVADGPARAIRKRYEDEVEGVQSAQYAWIARAIFEEEGDSVYPDATFTLRLAFGAIKGYELTRKSIPAFTTIGGAFGHAAAHGNTPPYELPPSWLKAKTEGRLKLETPLNFVLTADIIGGNSGSPVVNRANELVGLIFDGNIQSLILDFGYDDKVARAIAVDSRAIMEALTTIYRAENLVKELTTGKR